MVAEYRWQINGDLGIKPWEIDLLTLEQFYEAVRLCDYIASKRAT